MGEPASYHPASNQPAPSQPASGQPAVLELSDVLQLLRCGELDIQGRLVEASNATLYCSVTLDGVTSACVYKPVRGERPLWDFPDGTLAGRELSAYLVSAATGWGVVPPTVLRDGPFGPGMCQLWIDVDEDVDLAELARSDRPELRRMAVLDAVINNADRKGGHLLPTSDGPIVEDAAVEDAAVGNEATGAADQSAAAVADQGPETVPGGGGGMIYGVDHGICFSTEDKLRTLLWQWRGQPLTEEAVDVLSRLRALLEGPLSTELAEHLTRREVRATTRRVDRLLTDGVHPFPSGDWPALPWPPF